MSGFDRACRSAQVHGYAPVVRPTGGRAVAYDETCLVFDLVCREDEMRDPAELFAHAAGAMAHGLHSLGVDARVGPVAGEYCPGEFSVNARGEVKLIGTSQRAVRGARLLSGMLALGPVEELAEVVGLANASLELDWDRATFGTLSAEAPGGDRAAVEDVLVRSLLRR